MTNLAELGTREGLTDTGRLRGDVTTSLPTEATITGQIEFQHAPRILLIRVDGNPAPRWLGPTSEALNRLSSLGANWDSYGALPIDPAHLVSAIELLSLIMRESTPVPSVVPTTQGSVQLEWHTRGVDLEIEVLSPQRFIVSFEDAVNGDQWEREITVDVTLLVKAIDRITGNRRSTP